MTNYRLERIERLLEDLKYEIIRGMMEGEVDETLTFQFHVPVSKRIKDGVVSCEFRSRPVHRANMNHEITPKLRVIK